jgi:hypothetical protein
VREAWGIPSSPFFISAGFCKTPVEKSKVKVQKAKGKNMNKKD